MSLQFKRKTNREQGKAEQSLLGLLLIPDNGIAVFTRNVQEITTQTLILSSVRTSNFCDRLLPETSYPDLNLSVLRFCVRATLVFQFNCNLSLHVYTFMLGTETLVPFM
jgi:hypothetical protein